MDIILSHVTIAAMVVIMEEKSNPDRMVWMLLPFLFVIPLIKNSGLLFAYYSSAVAVCITFKGEQNREKSLKEHCLYLFTPIASKFLWDAHIKMVYSAPNTTRHSMSVDYLQRTFGEKSLDEINLICDRFISKWFSDNSSLEWEALLLLLVVFIIAFFVGSRKKELTWAFVISISFYLIYKIGLLMMYLTNMPGSDALEVASYSRYQNTFSMIQICIVLIVYLEYIQTDKVLLETQLIRLFVKPICKIALIVLMVFMAIHYKDFKHPDYAYDGVSRIVKTLTKKVDGFDVGDKVLVYHSYYFNGTFTKWALDNNECRQTYNLEEVQAVLTKNEENFEWLLVLEGKEDIQDLLQQYDYELEGYLVRLIVSVKPSGDLR